MPVRTPSLLLLVLCLPLDEAAGSADLVALQMPKALAKPLECGTE